MRAEPARPAPVRQEPAPAARVDRTAAEPSRGAAAAPISEPGWEVRVPGSGVPGTAAPAPEATRTPASRPGEQPRPAAGPPSRGTDVPPPPVEDREAPVDEYGPADVSPGASSAVQLDLQRVRDSWPEILEAVKRIKLAAWTVVYTAQPLALRQDILTLGFISENDVAGFRQQQNAGRASARSSARRSSTCSARA
nr:hypothetical protein [Naasia aerilata]